MGKEKIVVYNINSLSKQQGPPHQLVVENFHSYLQRNPKSLHNPHRHSFFHLVFFTKGAGTHSIDFTTFKVAPYQVYFMIPGQVHSWQFEGDVDGYIVNFSDELFRSYLINANYLESFQFFSGISEDCVCQLPASIHKKALELFTEMVGQPNDQEHGIELTRLLLMQFFTIVERACTIPIKNEMVQHKQVLLKKFRQLIEQHYRVKKLPKEYADLLFVTPNYLNAMCRELLGKTAGELIRDRVLLEAKRLLTKAAGLTVSEIATDLNFQDNSYFNRFFKKYAQITPDEFRKKF